MISGSSVTITQTQADTVFNSVATQLSSFLNLLVDFRYVIIAILFFTLIIRILRKKRNSYTGGSEVTTESRAVSGTGNKYGSIGGKAKNKGSIRNRFGFK